MTGFQLILRVQGGGRHLHLRNRLTAKLAQHGDRIKVGPCRIAGRCLKKHIVVERAQKLGDKERQKGVRCFNRVNSLLLDMLRSYQIVEKRVAGRWSAYLIWIFIKQSWSTVSGYGLSQGMDSNSVVNYTYFWRATPQPNEGEVCENSRIFNQIICNKLAKIPAYLDRLFVIN